MRLGDGLHSMQMEARYGEASAKRRAKLNPRHRELLKLERELFEDGQFGLYVANSSMIRDEVIARYAIAEDRIVVIPNGVRTDIFNPSVREKRPEVRKRHGIPVDAKLVLFSGMDFRRKGLMEAVEGFIALDRDDAWFACVGPGYTDKAEARLLQAGKRERAVFVDHTEAIAQWYGAADVFVLPTSHDPSANAVTESIACGTPVITSAQNGAKQHLQFEECGLVLKDREDASELASKINRLLDSPPHPSDVIEHAQLVSHWENASRLLEVLERAVELRKSGPVH
jgi:UDP-glucose:(heptosyl)LPS alpha-1,3-glucosyltransferase